MTSAKNFILIPNQNQSNIWENSKKFNKNEKSKERGRKRGKIMTLLGKMGKIVFKNERARAQENIPPQNKGIIDKIVIANFR